MTSIEVAEAIGEPEELAAAEARAEVLRVASERFGSGADWREFFVAVLAPGSGLVRKRFGSPEALARFEASPEGAAVRRMLGLLLAKARKGPAEQARRVITVRLPAELYEALKVEAWERNTSLNELCVSRLLRSEPPLERHTDDV